MSGGDLSMLAGFPEPNETNKWSRNTLSSSMRLSNASKALVQSLRATRTLPGGAVPMCISRDPSPTPNNDELTDEAGTWGLLFSAFGRATDEMLYPRFRDTGSAMGWAQNKAKEDVRILNAQDIA